MLSPEFDINQQIKRRQRHIKLRQLGLEIIYIIKCEESYKIGRTFNVGSRFHSIQVANPHKILLVIARKVENAPSLEKQLHRHFIDKRVRGEWFNLDESDLSYIKTVLEENRVEKG